VDYPGALFRKLIGVSDVKRLTSAKLLFEKEQEQKEGSFISRFNMYWETPEGVPRFIFLFNV
jgi:hypothetical protein